MLIDFKQEYDSKEELMFSFYLSELISGGWLKSAEYHPPHFQLSEDVKVGVFIKGKNENKFTDIKLLGSHIYTADWLLKWNKKSHGIFYWLGGSVYNKGVYPYSKANKDNFVPFKAANSDEPYSYIDVKGESVGRNNSSAITFPINQKYVMQQFDVFIQKITVSLSEKGIFAKTFTPRQVIIDEVYKVNCKTGKIGESKIKYQPVLLEQFLKLKNKTT